MVMSIRIGGRLFAPSWGATLLMLLLCAAFVALGRWQWHRGQARQVEWNRYAAGTDRLQPLDSRGLEQVARFQRVSLTGNYDPDHQFLLDNRSYQGRPGYEVLTPLHRPNGRVMLVDRGWVPFLGRRDQLPDVRLNTRETIAVTGRVADLPSAGLASGRAAPQQGAPWPRVTSFPTMQQLSAALGVELEARLVWLDPDQEHGYVRDWHPPGLEPMRHWSYAVQWWSFAVLSVALWAGLSLRKPTRAP
jgi:surfeit locus 1 family protein